MHGAPFANIAHGNNSIVADRLGLKLGEYLITESGFASDLGMEKFMDIVCRAGGMQPHAVVIVATVRALCMHGGGGLTKPDNATETLRLIEVGCENLAKHIENVREFGIEPVVAVNQRPEDTAEELALVKRLASEAGALSAVHNGFGAGGPGAAELAEAVVEACDRPTNFQFLYTDDAPFKKKIEAIATRIYGADGVDFAPAAIQRLKEFEAQGLGHFTVCMAKTHLSLSADPNAKGRPRNFRIPVRDVRAYTGAGFIVPLCGDMLQMPGLGKQAAGFEIDIDKDGKIVGMF
jgi:formyltetrahydrofolate synthetase